MDQTTVTPCPQTSRKRANNLRVVGPQTRADDRRHPQATQFAKATPATRAIGALRILFGGIWAIDAILKWETGFRTNFLGDLMSASVGQPRAVQAWIDLWVQLVKVNPAAFATLEALAESLLAVCLLAGAFTNVVSVGGIGLCLMIWSTAEGFGGPYGPQSTDVGAALVYALVFAALLFTGAGRSLGVDRYLAPKLGRWSFLASGACSKGDLSLQAYR